MSEVTEMSASLLKRVFIPGAAIALCFSSPAARADVVTNVWINPEGGYWADEANWRDGKVAVSTNVADFSQLASGSKVTIKKNTYVGGLVFDGAEGDAWTIDRENDASLVLRTSLFGYTPIYVGGGSLTNALRVQFEGTKIVRKEGAGTLVAANHFPFGGDSAGNQVVVEEGLLTSAGRECLYQANVHVTGTGSFALPNLPEVWLCSYSSDNGCLLDVSGRRVMLGTANDSRLAADSVQGSGTLTSVAGNMVVVDGATPGVTYEAREGVFQFGDKFMVGRWKFDDPDFPGRDSSSAGNDLAVSNSVTVVDDPDRGKVALFGVDSSLFGTGPDRSVKMMPSGNESYTVSAWVKMGTKTPSNAAIFFWGALPVAGFKGLICRRDASSLYAGHGGSGPYGAAGLNDGAWHHVAITYDGTARKITTYGDGAVLAGENAGSNPYVYNQDNFSVAANFAIGFPWSGSTSYPEGMMMDDARLFGRCLSADEVAQLKDNTLSCDYPAIPDGVGFATSYNGELRLFGDQTISEIGGDGVLGGVKVLSGATLTVTGAVAVGKAESAYGADIAGDVSLVKDGASTKVRLTGGLSYTGSTHVKAGTLAVGEFKMFESAFAVYDFESEDLGVDSSGNWNNLVNYGATRVWDADRGSWVARFDASKMNCIYKTANFSASLTNDSDYTVSVWAKPSANCPEEGSFVSFGGSVNNYGQIQFRFNKFSQRTLVLAHWGGTYDFTGIPSTASSPAGEWHHYVAVRQGSTFKVYVDGTETWTMTKSGPGLSFARWREINIGSFFHEKRYFDGDMDDVFIFDHALDADAVKELYARPKLVSVSTGGLVPTPVLHYAFEDPSNPGKDSSTNGCDLAATGSLTCEDSPIGGKALVFDTSDLSYLSAPLPSAIPAAAKPMTVTFWAQHGGSAEINSGDTFPTFVSWGKPGSPATIDFMFAFSVNAPWRPRIYMPGVVDEKEEYNLLWNPKAPDDLRWHHFAISYDPPRGLKTYIDGQLSPKFSVDGARTNGRTEGGTFYLGLKPTNLTHPFRGRLDEVKVYDVALTKDQVRSAIRAERHLGSRVLPAGTDVVVDAGATLAVDGGVHFVSSLSGAGVVRLAHNARLNVMSTEGFTGTVAGEGRIGIADGAALDFGGGSSPVVDVDHPVELGANVTVRTTVRSGNFLVARASSFVGVENLEGWTATIGGPRYRFVLSADGTSIYLRIDTGFRVLIR